MCISRVHLLWIRARVRVRVRVKARSTAPIRCVFICKCFSPYHPFTVTVEHFNEWYISANDNSVRILCKQFIWRKLDLICLVSRKKNCGHFSVPWHTANSWISRHLLWSLHSNRLGEKKCQVYHITKYDEYWRNIATRAWQLTILWNGRKRTRYFRNAVDFSIPTHCPGRCPLH